MENKYVLDRSTYKQLKAMDKNQMSEIMTSVYISGKEDAVDLDMLRDEISVIKGVGESRLNEIMEIIENHLNRVI